MIPPPMLPPQVWAMTAAVLASARSALWQELETLHPAEPWAARAAAVEAALTQEAGRFQSAVLRWQAAPRRLRPPATRIVWQSGSTALRQLEGPCGSGRPILAVPSLINRWTILGLGPAGTGLQALAASGPVYVVDWAAGPLEPGLDLDAAIAVKLADAAAWVRAAHGDKAPHLLGYCMGGTLAAGLAALRPRLAASLVLLAAPWDFHAVPEDARLASAALTLMARMSVGGVVAPAAVRGLFLTADPASTLRKYARAADWGAADPRWDRFVAVEDWTVDAVPLPAPAAAAVGRIWYGENAPGRGAWHIAGEPVAGFACPALILAPQADRLVPTGSALGFRAALPAAELLTVPLGHVGLIVAERAAELVWQPVLGWLRTV